MQLKLVKNILRIIEEFEKLSTLLPQKVVYNYFENKINNLKVPSPFCNIPDKYKEIKELVYRGYINGIEKVDENVKMGEVLLGVPIGKIQIIGLTKKGHKFLKYGGVIRWKADQLQSFLKEYDEINKMIIAFISVLISSVVSFCGGAVMALALKNLFHL